MRQETDAVAVSEDISFTRNRELSWLQFNERVLGEADDGGVPLLERLKFAAIFTSNLDEFFMVRVGSLRDLSLVEEHHADNKSGMTPREQLEAVFAATAPLYERRDRVLEELERLLRQYEVCRLRCGELEAKERKHLHSHFKSYILPVLAPQIVDGRHPFPHIENKALSVVMLLRWKGESRFGIIPIPRSLPRAVFLPGGAARYVLTEDIILEYAAEVFERYTVSEKAVISVTRNADLKLDDESYDFEEDFRLRMKKILKKRARLAAVRLEMQVAGPAPLVTQFLLDKLGLGPAQQFICKSPLELSYVYHLEEQLPPALRRSLTYPAYQPRRPAGIRPGESILRLAARRDLLLCYPYHSMDAFLQLMKEAAADPSVISVQITLYRIDKQSRLAEYLIAAAEGGKEVTVVMELRARFDEQNNIEWAERLQEAGCKVIYGFEDFKVHAKLCLITRLEKNRLQRITQVGTGNYNEKTGKIYADLSLITANEELGADAAAFFKNMLLSETAGRYERLLVAPAGLKPALLAMIDEQMRRKQAGRSAGILLKLNSLTDRQLLDKLSQASQAGVPVRLIVRGICCLLPGVPGRTETVRVRSIVGRFLEHARVYCFGGGEDIQVYIASADVMTRNTERRIEIACPVLDEEIKGQILSMLRSQLEDNVKAWDLEPDGQYVKRAPHKAPRLNSQEEMMEWAVRTEGRGVALPGGGGQGIQNFLVSILERIRPAD